MLSPSMLAAISNLFRFLDLLREHTAEVNKRPRPVFRGRGRVVNVKTESILLGGDMIISWTGREILCLVKSTSVRSNGRKLRFDLSKESKKFDLDCQAGTSFFQPGSSLPASLA
jgi:hypothetical protein